jgi:hypothetical protein
MPELKYALESGGPERLVITWKGMFKDFAIQLDGAEVGTVPDQKALKEGEEFSLPDGSTLKVQLVQKLTGSELQVLRDGEPLPGSASDPKVRLKWAVVAIFIIAGLDLLLGLIAVMSPSEFLSALGFGLLSIIFGAIFLVLGFLVRGRSEIALILSIALLGIDTVVGLVLGAEGREAPDITSMLARILMLIPMLQGVPAIRQLKQKAPPPAE